MDFALEQQIIHQLLLRSSIGDDIGLFDGKMGLIIFFYHYFRHTGNSVYKDTALHTRIVVHRKEHTHKERRDERFPAWA